MHQQQQRSSLNPQSSRDLSLYFTEIDIMGAKTVSCIQIFQDFLYAGTRQFIAYSYQLVEDKEAKHIQLINQRIFSAHCKSAKLIVASEEFLIIVPEKEQQLIRLWDRNTLKIMHGYQGHEKQISTVIFLRQTKFIASCSADGTVRVWRISQKIEESSEISRYSGVFPLLTVAEMEEENLAIGGDDSVITIWNWKENTVLHKCFSHLGSTTSLSFCSPNYLFSTGGDSKLIIWKMSDENQLRKVELFRKKTTQKLSVVQMGRHQILVIDSSGKTYFLDGRLHLGCSQLKIQYSETIANAKLWKDHLFAIIHNSYGGTLKEIEVDLQELREGSKPKLKLTSYIFSGRQMSISLAWKNLTLTDPSSGAVILKGLNGCFQSGNFVSIMGPSGAGKSSLLSLLTCRLRKNNTNLKIDGYLFLNGEEYSLQEFSRLAAYVQQDDVLFGALTVKETFEFQAKLKLWSLSRASQEKRCKQILQKLNLMDCAETMVGNSQFKKSISGGQKKRVAIGVELLSNPHILVFDEPTSGLDSHNALKITRLLDRLAREEGKLVIATIHQPSTLIFREMGHLYLLNSGNRVYSGFASNIVPYMESLGISLNYHMNPADFFMLEISKLKGRQGYVTPLNSDSFDKQYQPPQATALSYTKQQILNRCNSDQGIPFSKQFWPLVERGVKNFYRTPSNQINKPLTGLLIPFFLGIMYLNIGKAPEYISQSFLFNFFAYIFMGQYIVFAMNIYDTCLLFPEEKQIIFKEAGSNLYSLIAYFISKLATQILGSVIPAITNGIIVYFMGGLDPSFNHLAIFIGIYILLSICGFLFGTMFGVLNKNAEKAINLMPLVVIPLIIFGGLVININDIPVYVRWLSYVTPLRHSFIIVFKDQLLTDNFTLYKDLNLPATYGLDGDPFVALGSLLGLTGLYLIMSIVLLMLLKKKI